MGGQTTDVGLITGVVKRHLRLSGPDPDWDNVLLRDLGLDSMTAIELVLDLEAELDVIFTDNLLVVETFASIRSLEAAIASLKGHTT